MNTPLTAIDPLGLDCFTWDGKNVPCTKKEGDPEPGENSGGVGFWYFGGGSHAPLEATDTGGSGGGVDLNAPLPQVKPTATQCAAIRVLLAREEKYSTTTAAYMSSIAWPGDKTLEAFNSSEKGKAYVSTAAGTVKLDWFTEIRKSTMIPMLQLPAYVAGKYIWDGNRLITGAPITNFHPSKIQLRPIRPSWQPKVMALKTYLLLTL